MNLTKNFTLEEMIESPTARSRGISEQFTPSPYIVGNLTALCVNVLQPLRGIVGKPIRVSSGWRCLRVNKLVGGVENSQHKSGEAADLEGLQGVSNSQLFEIIKSSDLPFDQLIWEYGTDEEPDWVHVSFSKRNRRQTLRIKKREK